MRAVPLFMIPSRAWLVVGALVSVTATHEARACGNAWMREAPRIARLREADRALDEDDLARARTRALEVLSDRDADRHEIRRARRLHALAVARREGALPDELATSEATLRELVAGDPEDVTLQADLGEVLAAGGHDDEAKRLLEPLDARDLLGSRHAASALALVRARGDEKASTAAPVPEVHAAQPSPVVPRPAGAALLAATGVLGSLLAWLRKRRTRLPYAM